jgi:hypothetical protein
MSVPTIHKWSNTMADIIEEIGDLIGEEDKGAVRTASRVVNVDDLDSLNSGQTSVTVKDLVSVDEVVTVEANTEEDGDYKPVLEPTADGDLVSLQGSVDKDNVVTVTFKQLDISDDGTTDPSIPGNVDTSLENAGDTGSVYNVKVIARGY